MNRKYLLYAIVPVLALISFGTAVYAFGPQEGSRGAGLVAKIAQRFNLNQADVQTVFDEQRTEMQAQTQTRIADRISKAVTDGKITQAQADLIIAKEAEIKAFRDGLQGKTKDEIFSAMKTETDSLKQWVKDNNIPAGFLPFGGFGGIHMGRGANPWLR